MKHQTERSGTFKAGDSRASEAGRKGGSVKGPTKARDMKGKTRVKPKAMSGIKEGKDW